MKTMFDMMKGINREWLFAACVNSTSFDGLANDIVSEYPHLTKDNAKLIAAFTLRTMQLYSVTKEVMSEKDTVYTKEGVVFKVAQIVNA